MNNGWLTALSIGTWFSTRGSEVEDRNSLPRWTPALLVVIICLSCHECRDGSPEGVRAARRLALTRLFERDRRLIVPTWFCPRRDAGSE
jgi:hypothetical protein